MNEKFDFIWETHLLEKIMNGLPEGFINRMNGLLEEETDAFFSSYEKPRKYGLRCNTLKCTPENFTTRMPFYLQPVPWADNGYYYEAEQAPGKHPFHEAGVYYIQEPSAMSPAQLLDAKPGDVVCDLCAAPGGKSTQLASQLQGEGLLVSNELYPARARVLSQNFERMGIRNGVVLNENTAHMAALFPAFFDKIMVDAPCSGEGMFRKDEAAREEWSPEQVRICADRQLEILGHAAMMCAPGGEMVYSTCTFSPEENESVIGHFLQEHPDFSLVEPGEEFRRKGFSSGHPEWCDTQVAADIRQQLDKTLRIFPHLTEGEGHFLAKLKRQGEDAEGRAMRRNTACIQPDKKCDTSQWRAFAKELELPELQGVYRKFGEVLYLVPAQMIDLKGIKVERAGLELGTMKKNRFEPAHALAAALLAGQCKRVAELSVEEAVRYIHGETLPCTVDNGWTLVTVEGFSIGWGKAVNGTLKNHYPKGIRR